jgi:putative protein kinase ArgK-like GTPase of G3E family
LDLAASSPGPSSLAGYDVILVNTSGGKDSEAALDVVVKAAVVERTALVMNTHYGQLQEL